MTHWGPMKEADRVMVDGLAGLLEELARQMRHCSRIEQLTQQALVALGFIHQCLNTLVAPEGTPDLLATLDQQAAELRDALAELRAEKRGEGEVSQPDSDTPGFPDLE